jgi:hypothetical protein
MLMEDMAVKYLHALLRPVLAARCVRGPTVLAPAVAVLQVQGAKMSPNRHCSLPPESASHIRTDARSFRRRPVTVVRVVSVMPPPAVCVGDPASDRECTRCV